MLTRYCTTTRFLNFENIIIYNDKNDINGYIVVYAE